MISLTLLPLMNSERAIKEEGLLESICEGDQNALRSSYESFGSGLFGWLNNFVKQRELAEDILQEVFVKIWKKACEFDRNKSKPFTWVFTICRNTALDFLKSKDYRNHKGQGSLDDALGMMLPSAQGISPEQIDIREKVDRHLTLDQKAVIDLLYFQGYSQSEAAEKLDIPLGTVKTRVRLAMKSLRKVFEAS